MKRARENSNNIVNPEPSMEQSVPSTEHTFFPRTHGTKMHTCRARLKADYVLGIQCDDARNHKNVTEKVVPLRRLARIYRRGCQQPECVSHTHTFRLC